VLPFAEAARVAAGQEDEQALGEVLGLVRRHALALDQLLHDQPAQSVDRQRLARVRRKPEQEAIGAASGARELAVGRVDEVVPHAVRIAREGDAPHRVGHVVVEAGEEAEPVLAGERSPSASGGSAHRDAARLPAQRLALVHADLEAALGQLVGGGQPGHTAAEHRDPAPKARRGRDRCRRDGGGGRERGRGAGYGRVAQEFAARDLPLVTMLADPVPLRRRRQNLPIRIVTIPSIA
jgi:hypothetical protein